MDYYDSAPVDDFDENNKETLNDVKKLDKGHAKIWGFVKRADGSLNRAKIDAYTSGFIGCRIRNAITGEFYKEIVGSADEDLYFKLSMATGDCKSKRGSVTLFYESPAECMRHLYCELSEEIIDKWEEKRNARLLTKKTTGRTM